MVETSTSREIAVAGTTTETLDRTDDPVRMYLREMGSVELLSREGEIAIAKRIEAGRNTMIAGLCESPLTFQAIIIWRDELLSEEILLRDVIDLEATFGRSLWTARKANLTARRLDEVGVGEAAPRRTGSAEPELDADGNPIMAEMDEDEDDEVLEHVAGRDGSRTEAARAGNAGPDRARLRQAGRHAGKPRMNATLSSSRSASPPPTRPPIRSCGPKSCSW